MKAIHSKRCQTKPEFGQTKKCARCYIVVFFTFSNIQKLISDTWRLDLWMPVGIEASQNQREVHHSLHAGTPFNTSECLAFFLFFTFSILCMPKTHICITLHNAQTFEVFQHGSCRFAGLCEDMNLYVNFRWNHIIDPNVVSVHALGCRIMSHVSVHVSLCRGPAAFDASEAVSNRRKAWRMAARRAALGSSFKARKNLSKRTNQVLNNENDTTRHGDTT